MYTGIYNRYNSSDVMSVLKAIKEKVGDDVSDKEVKEIAETVVKNTPTQRKRPSTVNLEAYLREMEGRTETPAPGIIAVESLIKFYSKGLPEGHKCHVTEDMINRFIELGVLEVDTQGNIKADSSGNPIINKGVASEIAGKEVSNYNEFIAALRDNSLSLVEDIQPVLGKIAESKIEKYLIGNFEEFGENDKLCDYRYALNYQAIRADFALYPGGADSIDTIEELCDAIRWKAKIEDFGVNGKIDGLIEQGNMGNCWFIAGILSLSSTDAGKEAISNAIQRQGDDFVVEFKGVIDSNGNSGIKITVTADEILQYDEDLYLTPLSGGDNDLLVLELAANKLHAMLESGEVILPPEAATIVGIPGRECYNDTFMSYLEGSVPARTIYLLTGQTPDLYFDNLTSSNLYNILSNAAQNPDTVLNFALGEGEHTAKTVDGGEFSLELKEGEGHALAILNVHEERDANGKIDLDKSTITFVNPWYSGKQYTVSWREFEKLDIAYMDSTNLNGELPGTTKKPEGNQVYQDCDDPMNNVDKFFESLQQFIKGNMNMAQLKAVLKLIGMDIANVYEKDNKIYVEVNYKEGRTATFVCDKNAVNDNVRGANGTEVPVFVCEDGKTIDGITFTAEEFATYFTEAAVINMDGETYSYGNFYVPSSSWPEGVTTAEELRAYLDGTEMPKEENNKEGSDILDFNIQEFLKGNMNIEQLTAAFKEIGIEVTKVYQEGSYTCVILTDEVGSTALLRCKTNAVNDNVKGDNGKEIKFFHSNDGRTVDGYTFTAEEFAKYFVDAATITIDGETSNYGNYYIPSSNWPEGVTSAKELKAYLIRQRIDNGGSVTGTDNTDSTGGTDNNKPAGEKVYASLEEALKDMNLRETFCKGVYCQHHNPEMPPGNYTHQKHFVWDEASHKMIELPGIYFISHDGHQAKGFEGYEQIMAYQKGYNFTETPGIYEKGGNKFTFNNQTGEFEQVK